MRLVILTSVSITFISGCANLGILSKYNPEPTQVSVQDFTFEQSSWEELTSIESVSYTHLTLPTILLV